MPTLQQYDQAFDEAATIVYSDVRAFEVECGYSLDRWRLDPAARVLACPVKANPPCWQHGRVIYAAARRLLSHCLGQLLFLDIGTAKGFSALCAYWAIEDDGAEGCRVISLDVVDPLARVARNTVAEVSGLKTLAEILSPWPESFRIEFEQMAAVDWLTVCRGDRINFAFVDGKHRYEVVAQEADLLKQLQQRGDVIIFDDVQIPGVARAVNELQGYNKREIVAHANRRYTVATRQ